MTRQLELGTNVRLGNKFHVLHDAPAAEER